MLLLKWDPAFNCVVSFTLKQSRHKAAGQNGSAGILLQSE